MTTSTSHWGVDDIDVSLAADFDGSLSGLGMELGTASFNMRDAEERPVAVHGKKNRLAQSLDEDTSSSTIKRFCISADRDDSSSSRLVGPAVTISAISLLYCCSFSTAAGPFSSPSKQPQLVMGKDTKYQFLLGAATSIATKYGEETMTYLNQGQSYEIKLKKVGDLTELRGKTLRSVIRVGFHERRLQFIEKEQLDTWQQQRPGEKILDIDLPLSYGIQNVTHDLNHINKAEFYWDPTKESGVFIKVNCISTEFTPKKHGGEKGVPFRIQLETFCLDERPHIVSCQVKVFKLYQVLEVLLLFQPKGADRKHKTDKEKMSKRPSFEQNQSEVLYQPPTTATTPTSTTVTTVVCPAPIPDRPLLRATLILYWTILLIYATLKDGIFVMGLSSEAGMSETALWLTQNRFSAFTRSFANFTGTSSLPPPHCHSLTLATATDLLRLSRDDLIQICGIADGIRLYNALHSRAIRPKLTLFVCLSTDHGNSCASPVESSPHSSTGAVFQAIYLESLTAAELCLRLTSSFPAQLGGPPHRIFLQGPAGIHVRVTDSVVANLTSDSIYLLNVLKALDDELLIVRYFKFCTEAGRMRKNAGQRILEDDLSVNS
ncbi:gem [Cordylochernes scorpioides]|uniref:Gem n=1 Tax=Cordylochernes scorpioides TaxID=51811 RepID=A0ABY6KC09_9ARAC|nr:gem [Cordylochernes scorpioides]